jgi:hypothetical protein
VNGVLPRGRFGGWRCESSNQDYAFMQGVEAVTAILHGKVENAYWPHHVRALCRHCDCEKCRKVVGDS